MTAATQERTSAPAVVGLVVALGWLAYGIAFGVWLALESATDAEWLSALVYLPLTLVTGGALLWPVRPSRLRPFTARRALRVGGIWLLAGLPFPVWAVTGLSTLAMALLAGACLFLAALIGLAAEGKWNGREPEDKSGAAHPEAHRPGRPGV